MYFYIDTGISTETGIDGYRDGYRDIQRRIYTYRYCFAREVDIFLYIAIYTNTHIRRKKAMEIKTCEQYVLDKLSKTENDLAAASDQAMELQRILYAVQSCLELNVDESGAMYITIDTYGDEGLENLLKNYLGRGKFGNAAENAGNDLEG